MVAIEYQCPYDEAFEARGLECTETDKSTAAVPIRPRLQRSSSGGLRFELDVQVRSVLKRSHSEVVPRSLTHDCDAESAPQQTEERPLSRRSTLVKEEPSGWSTLVCPGGTPEDAAVFVAEPNESLSPLIIDAHRRTLGGVGSDSWNLQVLPWDTSPVSSPIRNFSTSSDENNCDLDVGFLDDLDTTISANAEWLPHHSIAKPASILRKNTPHPDNKPLQLRVPSTPPASRVDTPGHKGPSASDILRRIASMLERDHSDGMLYAQSEE